jgi:tetratricopeptide (TPR) repeat protein
MESASRRSALRWRLSIALLLLSLFAAFGFQSLTNPQPGSVALRIIVVNSQKEAQQILERLKGGEDFATLAKDKSTDPTANEGGYLGEMGTAKLRLELQDALKGVGPGQLSAVVRIPAGYAILQVLQEPPKINIEDEHPFRTLPLAGAGSVRIVVDVDGFNEARAALNLYPKPDGWNQDIGKLCEVREQSLQNAIGQIERFVASSSQRQLGELEDGHSLLAQLWCYLGDLDKAVEHWQAAYQIATAHFPKRVARLDEVLGTIYLQRAAMDHSAIHTPVDGSRLFPMHAAAPHLRAGDSEKSIQYFLRSLRQQPDNYEVRWLLNLAYMTLNKYPGAVPKEYLIPAAAFASKEDLGRFVDVAPAAGLNVVTMAGGVIVDDFDNDGLLDVVISNFDDCAPMHYFHNNGDGTFSDRTAQAGLGEQLGGLNLIQTDYDNNGCLDILVLRGGWDVPKRNSLLRNNCDGTFTDVTRQSGLAEPANSSQTAVWVDIDNDGRLDLFVGNENSPSQLFWNKGDGTFEDISHAAGVDRRAFTKGVVAADYDNDGYPDLYVSNLYGGNFLYHNNGDRTFTEVSRQAGLLEPRASFGTWFFDYDNDGWPDLFVTTYYLSVEESMRSYLALPPKAETLKLYRNLGNGTFRDVTAEVGLNRVFMPMGCNFGDVDNDGFLDFYLGNGNPSFASVLPSVLFHNREGKSFLDITASSGTGSVGKGHGVAFADIDNDGDEDLFVVMGGAVRGDRYRARLFENPGHGNDWISLKLVGEKTNRAAIGARIKVTVENGGKRRFIYRTVGSGGSFGASPLMQHVGLGRSARIENLEIWWPASNTRQSFSNVGTNQFLEIRESAKSPARLERRPFRLGGAKRSAALR